MTKIVDLTIVGYEQAKELTNNAQQPISHNNTVTVWITPHKGCPLKQVAEFKYNWDGYNRININKILKVHAYNFARDYAAKLATEDEKNKILYIWILRGN